MSKQLTQTIFKHGTLLDLDVGRWSGIKKMTEEDLLLTSVDGEAMYLGHKKLVPKVAISNLSKLESQARAIVHRYSIDFPISGVRFVPLRALPDLIRELTEVQKDFSVAVDNFILGYNEMKSTQLRKLKEQAEKLVQQEKQKSTTFTDARFLVREKELTEWLKRQQLQNESFYPPAEEIRKKFRLRWNMFKLSEHEVDALDAERTEVLAAGQKQLQDDMSSWVKQASIALHQTLGEAAKSAKEMLLKHGKISPRSLAPLFEAFNSFKQMEFTGTSDFRPVIDALEAKFLLKDNGEVDFKKTSDSSMEMKHLLETVADLSVESIAQTAGIAAIQKSGEFSRVVEI